MNQSAIVLEVRVPLRGDREFAQQVVVPQLLTQTIPVMVLTMEERQSNELMLVILLLR